MSVNMEKKNCGSGPRGHPLELSGEREQAFAALERAYAEHDLQLQVLKVGWRMESLRSGPRFQDLLRRVGLA